MTESEPGDLREARIRELFPLVRTIARRLVRTMPATELGDLIGDGSVGLIRAVDGYDPARGIPLFYYARKMILGAMLNGLRNMDPLSERARRTIRMADRARYEQAQVRGRLPTLGEMQAETPGLDKALHAAFRAQPHSLDGFLARSETGLLDKSSDPAAHVLDVSRTVELQEAIALLPERQRRVVEMRYYDAMSLQAIGTTLRVSPQRASQLHQAALKRLRFRLKALDE